jgi:hypothetical protein
VGQEEKGEELKPLGGLTVSARHQTVPCFFAKVSYKLQCLPLQSELRSVWSFLLVLPVSVV